LPFTFTYFISYSLANNYDLYRKENHFLIGVTAIALYFNCNDVDFVTKSGRLKAPVLFLCTNNFHYVVICSRDFKLAKPAVYIYFNRRYHFVASDSILAFDKFYAPLKCSSSFLIMVTYLIAQYLIVTAF
jgi:hypothetical protein